MDVVLFEILLLPLDGLLVVRQALDTRVRVDRTQVLLVHGLTLLHLRAEYLGMLLDLPHESLVHLVVFLV